MEPEARPARNARKEAAARLRHRYDVRVLEPSPPAVVDEWFADDPTARGSGEGQVVAPVGTGDIRWDGLCGSNPDLDAWCADHWLGNRRRLLPIPSGFEATRESLHRLAFFVLSPARLRANEKMALRYTHRGFGTPFFGSDEQVRVEGMHLVVQTGETAVAVKLTSLADAAGFVGVPLDLESGKDFDAPSPGDPAERLEVREPAVSALADWYGFVTVVLEELRSEDPAGSVQTRVQLWPEHFDVAVEFGDADKGGRASFGGSPGDDDHPDPYLYVAPWSRQPRDPFWNESHFGGARMSYQTLLSADDQIETALRFFRQGKSLLDGKRD